MCIRDRFKDQEEFKCLKWALLKNAEDLTDDQRKKLNQVFLLTPQLKVFYENKEKFRLIFNQRLTREQGEIELNQWIEEENKMKNKYLNQFLCTLSNWKESVSYTHLDVYKRQG